MSDEALGFLLCRNGLLWVVFFGMVYTCSRWSSEDSLPPSSWVLLAWLTQVLPLMDLVVASGLFSVRFEGTKATYK